MNQTIAQKYANRKYPLVSIFELEANLRPKMTLNTEQG